MPDFLGKTVRCKITGFKGVVTAQTRWLSGCDTVQVQPVKLTKEGDRQAAIIFDANMVEEVTTKKKKVEKTSDDIGGPRPAIKNPRGTH